MSSPGLPAYPTVQPPAIPTPRPTPPAPSPPAQPGPIGQMPTPFTQGMSPQMQAAQADRKSANAALQTGIVSEGAAVKQQGDANVAFNATQGEAIHGIRTQEAQDLSKLDQGPFKPTHDTLAGMGALFMLVGMAGAFLGGKGSAAAAGNAQAALNGIVQGWNKGTDADFARQKAVFDENANYLKDQAQKVRQIAQEAMEEAKTGNVPGAVSDAHGKLLAADANVQAEVVKNKGLEALVKSADAGVKSAEQMEMRQQQLNQHQEQMAATNAYRMAALAAKGGGMGGALNQRYAANMVGSFDQVVNDVVNVTMLPGTNLGAFAGMTGKSGEGLISSLRDVAARKVTSADVRAFQQLTSALETNLATVLGHGYARSSSKAAMDQISAQIPRAGDKASSSALFLARLKQELGTFAQSFNSYPGANDDQKQLLGQYMDTLNEVVPFDVKDVLKAMKNKTPTPVAGADTGGGADKPVPTQADRDYVKAHPDKRDHFVAHFGVEP